MRCLSALSSTEETKEILDCASSYFLSTCAGAHHSIGSKPPQSGVYGSTGKTHTPVLAHEVQSAVAPCTLHERADSLVLLHKTEKHGYICTPLKATAKTERKTRSFDSKKKRRHTFWRAEPQERAPLLLRLGALPGAASSPAHYSELFS